MQQQPPPRKVKPLVALKNVHNEQLSKLQAKHQVEIEILDDIRGFSKQRSIIEKEYSQALLKLVSQYTSKKDVASTPSGTGEDGQEHKRTCGRTITSVWRTVLDETEKMAQCRLKAADIYMQKVSEPAKAVKNNKIMLLKKVVDSVKLYQSEVTQSVTEMGNNQKVYSTEEHLAHEVRTKLADAENRLKRKSTGLFQSRATLQKNSAKFALRKEACEVKSTSARNEYIISMAAANAHQIRYYSTDLPELMKILDGATYEKFQEFVTLIGKTELECCTMAHECLNKILMDSGLVSRQYSLQCFLRDHLVFTDLVQYQFDPCDNDQINVIKGEEEVLNKEARKWATKVAKDEKAIRDHNISLQNLQSQVQNAKRSSGDSSKSNPQDPAGQDPEQKLEEAKEMIRKIETSKMKAEARLEALRAAGVDVDEILSSAARDIHTPTATEADSVSQTGSQVSYRSDGSAGAPVGNGPVNHSEINNDDEYDDEFGDTFDTFEMTGNSTGIQDQISKFGRPYPIPCIALYNFEASNSDELTIYENEQLDIIGDGDGDGWLQARNVHGQVGYVPENYVHLTDDQSQVIENHAYTPETTDYPAEEATDHVTDEISYVPQHTTEVHHEGQSSYSSTDMEVQQTTMPTIQHEVITEGEWVRALYDYEATNDEELTFVEGQLIRLLRRDENGVDDGWWEGEINGKVGAFPSLVVEEVDTQELMQMSDHVDSAPASTAPASSVPPSFVPPPPVTITVSSPGDTPVTTPQSPSSPKPEVPAKPPDTQEGQEEISNNADEHSDSKENTEISNTSSPYYDFPPDETVQLNEAENEVSLV